MRDIENVVNDKKYKLRLLNDKNPNLNKFIICSKEISDRKSS